MIYLIRLVYPSISTLISIHLSIYHILLTAIFAPFYLYVSPSLKKRVGNEKVLLSLSQVYAQWTVQCELKDDWEIVFAGGRKETDYRLVYGLRLELIGVSYS